METRRWAESMNFSLMHLLLYRSPCMSSVFFYQGATSTTIAAQKATWGHGKSALLLCAIFWVIHGKYVLLCDDALLKMSFFAADWGGKRWFRKHQRTFQFYMFHGNSTFTSKNVNKNKHHWPLGCSGMEWLFCYLLPHGKWQEIWYQLIIDSGLPIRP